MQKRRSKNELLERVIGAFEYLAFVATPGQFAFVDQDDVVADLHHRVHVVCDDDGGGNDDDIISSDDGNNEEEDAMTATMTMVMVDDVGHVVILFVILFVI